MREVTDAEICELQVVCPGARILARDSTAAFIDLPDLRLPAGSVVAGLLRLGGADGYSSRLFLSEAVPNKGANWSVHQLFGRTWHTWSWNNVDPGERVSLVLTDHLAALR